MTGSIDERRQCHNGGAVLIVMQDRLLQSRLQLLLDLKTLGRGKILELDRTKGHFDGHNGLDDSTGCVSFSRIGTPLIPARSANNAALPSMTGIPASAPMFPRPSTAVPFVTMATVLSMLVKS